MQKHDLENLASALNGLAEVFDKKPVTQKAVEIWFDTLREFAAERVIGLLLAWPKTHGKMPLPAELWKILNEYGIEERAKTHAAEKAQRVREYASMGATPHGKAALKLIYAILAKPKRTPTEHWEWVLSLPDAPDISKEYARVGLAKLKRREQAKPARIPGADDEQQEEAWA